MTQPVSKVFAAAGPRQDHNAAKQFLVLVPFGTPSPSWAAALVNITHERPPNWAAHRSALLRHRPALLRRPEQLPGRILIVQLGLARVNCVQRRQHRIEGAQRRAGGARGA